MSNAFQNTSLQYPLVPSQVNSNINTVRAIVDSCYEDDCNNE
jgi:hypothetical protein